MDIGKMMQQARKMQEKMAQMQEDLVHIELVGEAGGGMVKAVVGGDRMLRSLEIDASLWSDEDHELIEDLIIAAVNSAAQQVEEKVKGDQQKMLSGLPLPPGFSL
ncbi:MAG: YbaB/EbfC family nucleoid-associated protein [Mariprofundaceae bacterium]